MPATASCTTWNGCARRHTPSPRCGIRRIPPENNAPVPSVTALFWLFAGPAVLSALLCITRRNTVASALWLVVTLFQLAALFVILNAEFIAVLQVLVYAGAIIVLFL